MSKKQKLQKAVKRWLEPIWLRFSDRLVVESENVQTRTEVADDVVRTVGGADHLRRDQDNVQQMTQEKETEGWEFEYAQSRVS